MVSISRQENVISARNRMKGGLRSVKATLLISLRGPSPIRTSHSEAHPRSEYGLCPYPSYTWDMFCCSRFGAPWLRQTYKCIFLRSGHRGRGQRRQSRSRTWFYASSEAGLRRVTMHHHKYRVRISQVPGFIRAIRPTVCELANNHNTLGIFESIQFS